MTRTDRVMVVIGTGGMGRAIVRRMGSDVAVVLSDIDERSLQSTADEYESFGYEVYTRVTDVSSACSVAELAAYAAWVGEVRQIAHTAGLSPSQAKSSAEVLAVDLLGVAHILESFGTVISSGGAGVVIGSMAAHLLPPLSYEQQAAIAQTPAADLLTLPFLDPDNVEQPGVAYAIAKQACLVRVRAASRAWGARSARINSISPGTIITPMQHSELNSEVGDGIRSMVSGSALQRMGTPDEIAAVAEFLLGPQSSFITGTDVLVDGGVVASTLPQETR